MCFRGKPQLPPKIGSEIEMQLETAWRKTGSIVSAVNFENEFSVQFAPLDNQLDEDSKLQAATIFDGLRVISNHYQNSSTPVFLGGLFAYDLVANFIPMQGVELKDDGIHCPDYSFYLAENLIYHRSPKPTSHIKKLLFSQEEQVEVAKNGTFYCTKIKKILMGVLSN